MGTNYYYYSSGPCPTCGALPEERKHIGKSSAGWCFSLHVYPDEEINDLNDWKRAWKTGFIQNEYGETITVKSLLSIITKRRWSEKEHDLSYYERNEAVPGPHNLMRHKIGRYCIKHSRGTWDCVVGDFS